MYLMSCIARCLHQLCSEWEMSDGEIPSSTDLDRSKQVPDNILDNIKEVRRADHQPADLAG